MISNGLFYSLINSMQPINDVLFQQDNEPYHQEQVTQEYINDYFEEFQGFLKPLRSAKEVHEPAIKIIRDMMTAIEMAWFNICPQLYRPPVKSIVSRVAAISRARQYHKFIKLT